MPIPDEETVKEHEEYVREQLRLTDEWDIDVQVLPYLPSSVAFGVNIEDKEIDIQVYSARYPMSWGRYKEQMLGDMRDGIKEELQEDWNKFYEEGIEDGLKPKEASAHADYRVLQEHGIMVRPDTSKEELIEEMEDLYDRGERLSRELTEEGTTEVLVPLKEVEAQKNRLQDLKRKIERRW